MDAYELNRKLSNYKTMKENVINMINVLSRSDILDNLSDAQNSLKNYYSVNNISYKSNNIEKEKEKISNSLASLKNILFYINSNVKKLKASINDLDI